jgi:WD40 repeat protein
LIKRRGTGIVKGGDNKTDGTGMDTKQMKDDSESVSLQKRTEEESKQLDQKNETKVKSGMESGTGMQTSQSMLSSMLEGSEDEESRRQDAKRKKREEKRGLSDAEKNAQVDITLSETETMTLMYIPGTICTDPNDESMNETKDYKVLLSYKVGADSYNNRGSQTLNLTQKPKDIAPDKIFMLKDMKVQVNNYEIEEENRKIKEDDGAKMIRIYEKSIEDIMSDKLKDERALIDSEELASHISIYSQTTTQGNVKTPAEKSGSRSGTSGRSSKNKTSGKEGEGTSKSIVKESDTKSGLSDKLSSSSTTAQQIGGNSKTSGFPDSTIPNKMEFTDADAPSYDPTSMLKAIKIIERLLTQSKYHKEHVLYTDYPQVTLSKASDKKDDEEEKKGGVQAFDLAAMASKEDEQEQEESEDEDEMTDEKDPIRLKPLFKFECEFTRDRNITCMDFNKTNPDLLAVAYGEYDMNRTDTKNTGLVAFWTLKNPNFPEKMIKTENSVTSLEFSTLNPNLLAIGDSAGGIAIYDVQNDDDIPIAESREIDEKHTDAIWEVKWVRKAGKGEVLVSVSGDGRVIEWSLKKGLEFNELMQLKRQANPVQKETNSMPAGIDEERKTGMTFINTGGLSIDFPVEQSANYFASTEDGTVNRCSVSYSERSLYTYQGHTGPVYKVRCTPFWSDDCQIFLTCSYDWTVRVWNHKEPIGKQEKLICREQHLQKQVNDIAWSPGTSSVFALVADDGRVEIWDLFKNNLEPKLSYFDKINKKTKSSTAKTSVRWSRQSPVLVTGNVEGVVHVYRTNGLEHVQVSNLDQAERLLESIRKDDFAEDAKDSKRKNDGDLDEDEEE